MEPPTGTETSIWTENNANESYEKLGSGQFANYIVIFFSSLHLLSAFKKLYSDSSRKRKLDDRGATHVRDRGVLIFSELEIKDRSFI